MGHAGARDQQEGAPHAAAPALRADPERADPAHALRHDEPAVDRTIPAGRRQAVRRRDLRRGIADPGLGRHRRDRPRQAGDHRRRSRAAAADQRRPARRRRRGRRRLRRCRASRASSTSASPRTSRACGCRLALPQPPREPDRVLEPAILSRRAGDLPLAGDRATRPCATSMSRAASTSAAAPR